jgi:hypothetical protein
MYPKLAAVSCAVILLLTGCSAPPDAETPDTPEVSSETADFAIQTVKDRYEVDCFAKLGDSTTYRFEPWTIEDGSQREGTVYASVGGNIIELSVGFFPNGGYFTAPVDDFSIETLESVGC